MDFSEALLMIKQGSHLTRKGWNGTGMHIQMYYPDKVNFDTPFIAILPDARYARITPWVASQTDLLAQDWEEC